MRELGDRPKHELQRGGLHLAESVAVLSCQHIKEPVQLTNDLPKTPEPVASPVLVLADSVNVAQASSARPSTRLAGRCMRSASWAIISI